jgi:Malectin domain
MFHRSRPRDNAMSTSIVKAWTQVLLYPVTMLSLVLPVVLQVQLLLVPTLYSCTTTSSCSSAVVGVTAQPSAIVTLPFRINCGGPLLIDDSRNNNNNNSSSTTTTRWEADTQYNLEQKGKRRNRCSATITTTTTTTTTTGVTIQNVPSNVTRNVYCSQRFYPTTTNTSQQQQPYQYNIPVPNNAFYTVRLHFAELVRVVILCCTGCIRIE